MQLFPCHIYRVVFISYAIKDALHFAVHSNEYPAASSAELVTV